MVQNPVAGGTCTLTLAGATAGKACGITVYFVQRASGDSSLAFAGGTILNMNNATLPGPNLAANATSVYSFTTVDGGATWYGFKAGDSAVYVPPTVPAAPTAVVGTRGSGQVSVAFTPGASNGAAITGYTVTSTPGSLTASGAGSPIVVTSLTNGTAYTFTVHATNSVGNSVESSPSAAVTPATVPGAPTGVVGTPGNTTASIAFTAPGSAGGSAITGYTATLSPGGATFSGASSPIAATGLTNGTAYTATVHATNAVGNSSESSVSSPFTPLVAPTAPGAPTIGTATAGDAQATVTWTAPASNGGSAITGYRVTPYIGATAQSATTVGVILTATVTSLTNGTAYTFKVAAINAIGTGPDSAASNAVTPAPPPLAADDFNRADGTLAGSTASGGGVWAGASPFLISSNRVGGSVGTNVTVRLAVGQPAQRTTVAMAVLPATGYVGVTARWTDDNNCYIADVGPTGDARLIKFVAGAFSFIGTAAAAGTFVAGDTLGLVVNGTAISVERNGTPIGSLTVTDSSLATGNNAGLWNNSADGTYRMDNFNVYAP